MAAQKSMRQLTDTTSSLVAGAIIAVMAVIAYGGSFDVPLLFDDIPAIEGNTSIRHWTTAWHPPVATTVGGRPILNVSLAANYAIGGTSVASYHVVNLLIHVLAGLTLFGILRRAFARRPDGKGTGIALAAALLWTVHPLQTESVTYVIQRAESLMGLFYLLTLYCFIRGATAEGTGHFWFAGAVGACLLGMGTKEVMVSAPLLVLLYDRMFLAGSFREAWRSRWRVYVALGGTWLFLLGLVLSTDGRGGSAGLGAGISVWDYWQIQLPALFRYIRLSLWPDPLVFYYGVEPVPDLVLVLPAALALGALLAAIAWGLARSGSDGRSLGFAGTWFLALLAPTSLIPIVLQTSAEHRMYLALVPVMTLLVLGAFRYLGRGAWPACLALGVAFAWLTFERNKDYRSELAIWNDTVAKVPANAYARYNLGNVLEKLPGREEDAMAQYREALRLRPDLDRANINLGNILVRRERTAEAVNEFEAALRLKGDSAPAHNNLGNVLLKMPGREAEGMAHIEEALRLKPNYPEAENNLGGALASLGRLEEAVDHYEAALRLKPDYAEAHYNLGNVLMKMPGRQADAVAQFESALRARPDYAEAHNNLGSVLVAMGRPGEAVAHYEATLRIRPDFAQAHFNLGTVLGGIPGRMNEAIAHFGAAVREEPGSSQARINLGIALTSQGRTFEAIAELEEALRREPGSASALNALGNALFTAGRPGEALVHYQAAVREKPDYAQAYYNLGNALGRTPGRLSEAVAPYEEAIRLQPDFLEAHFNLAVAFLKLSVRTREARQHLETVLRIQPGNEAALQILDQIGR
jgi:tetratricopeptide (TPR) repeat protein